MTLGGIKKQLVYAAGHGMHASGAFRLMHRAVVPDTVSIALYHGVTAEPLRVRDWCFTSAASFVRQMEYLAAHFDVVHLEEALAPERPVATRPLACLTFDEGFEGVYDYAFPVLERLGLRATVYLVTDLVDSDETVWSVRLHQALSEATIPTVSHGEELFRLDDAASRARASQRLQQLLKHLPAEDFQPALESLLERLGFGERRARRPQPGFGILGERQIRRMSRDDLVRFGAHTATHQILTRTSPARAHGEVERSIVAVSRLVAQPSATFAYPNGRPEDFDQGVVSVLRALGVRYAVTTIEGPNDRQADPYRLRRYGIGAEDPVSRFAGLMHHGRSAARRLLSVGGGALAALGRVAR